MWKHFVKIQNSQLSIDRMYPSINRMYPSIDRNHEENFDKLSGWLNRFSILIRSIEKANSINRKEFSIGWKLNKFITKSRVDSIDSRFLFDRLKRNIQSIEGNSWLVETRKIEFSRIFTKQFSMVFHEQTTIIWT